MTVLLSCELNVNIPLYDVTYKHVTFSSYNIYISHSFKGIRFLLNLNKDDKVPKQSKVKSRSGPIGSIPLSAHRLSLLDHQIPELQWCADTPGQKGITWQRIEQYKHLKKGWPPKNVPIQNVVHEYLRSTAWDLQNS
jgi:hypothetical protein